MLSFNVIPPPEINIVPAVFVKPALVVIAAPVTSIPPITSRFELIVNCESLNTKRLVEADVPITRPVRT